MKLLPCPFCGNKTPDFSRMGTGRQSCIVECGNCSTIHESSDEGERSGASWNYRQGERDLKDALKQILRADIDTKSIQGGNEVAELLSTIKNKFFKGEDIWKDD